MWRRAWHPVAATLPVALVFLLGAAPSGAGELSVLYGRTEAKGAERESSFGWQADFRSSLLPRLAGSIAYLNEGHVPGRKRDGLAAQLWGETPLFRRRVSLALGAGIYNFYDTKTVPGGFENAHGVAGIYSLSATWNTGTPWFGRLAVNRVDATGGFDTNTILLGAGYRLWETRNPPGPEGGDEAGPTGDEITLLVGRTVVNSLQDQKGVATEIELRKGILPRFDATVSWLNEGDAREIRRNGLAGQLWLTNEFLDDRLTLGLGGGAYYFLDRKRAPAPGRYGRGDLAGLATLMASWRFTEHWFARTDWHRVVTGHNTDTDVFLAGFGYRLM